MGPSYRSIVAIAALLLAQIGPGGATSAGAFTVEHTAGAAPQGAPIRVAAEPADPKGESPAPDPTAGVAVGGVLLFADTPEQAAMTLDALRRFAESGLELPPGLEIHFHTTLDGCGGHRGLATHGTDFRRIDMCRTHQFTLMHEMAHMWAEHTLTERDRRTFLDERGLQSWRDGVPWDERGSEHAAHVVAWGVGDRPIQLAEIPDTDFDRLTSAFELLTGSRPRFLWDAAGPADERPALNGSSDGGPGSLPVRARPR